MTSQQPTWTGMVPVDDTALYVRDTGGRGHPVVYLNGAHADQSHWRRVIADLGSDYLINYRHLTYDQRARGKSKRSADYSFEGAVRAWPPAPATVPDALLRKADHDHQAIPWTGMIPVEYGLSRHRRRRCPP